MNLLLDLLYLLDPERLRRSARELAAVFALFTVLAVADYFFLDYDKYAGSLVDSQVFFEHRTFKHVGFGAGLNNFAFDLQVDDEQRFWDVQNIYRGYLAYVSFFF